MPATIQEQLIVDPSYGTVGVYIDKEGLKGGGGGGGQGGLTIIWAVACMAAARLGLLELSC